MKIKEIQEFGEIRTRLRAYLCYILGRNLPSRTPGIDLDSIKSSLKKISDEIGRADSLYVLDSSGKQLIDTISTDEEYNRKGRGENRNKRAYYYRVVKEKRCVITDPYPSLGGNKLVVTAAFPVFDDKNRLIYIVCVDITLDNILKMMHPSSVDSITGKVTQWVYAFFSGALFLVAAMLFAKAINSFITYGLTMEQITVKDMFESTILLTLSLAIFDLVKAIFEEEVLGASKKHAEDDIHKTMVRFLGSIIIALSIEALMLVFKFALTDPNKMLVAVGLLFGITALMIGLSIYLKAINSTRRR